MNFRQAVLAVAALLLASTVGADPALPGPGYVLLPQGEAAANAKHLYIFGTPYRWPATLIYRYNDAGRPATLSKSTVLAEINAAAAQWMASCNVAITQDASAPDTTTPAQTINGTASSSNQNVIGWGDLTTPPNGAANISGVTFVSSSNSALVDADTTYSVQYITSTTALKRVAVHELGHAIGLAHSNVPDQVMSGTASSQNPGVPGTPYDNLSDLQPDDVQGCVCLYGPSSTRVGQGYLCGLPTYRDFGSVSLGAVSATQAVTVKNAAKSGNLTLGATTLSSGEFKVLSGCASGTVLSPGASCTLNLLFAPNGATGSRVAYVTIGASSFGPFSFPVGGVAAAAGSAPVNVIEFYNAQLDHYFMSALQNDITALDSGALAGWARTGQSFRAYADAQAGASPVCRFYLPPPFGDSHFYSAATSECQAVRQRFPGFILESSAVMYVGAPDTTSGACPSGWMPVYRVWNNRIDTNHRYTTDPATRDRMVAAGGVAEGYGPNAVIMCAPP